MDGQTQFSAQQSYAPLRNWGIATLAITTVGVIASDLWLDQPIALFVPEILPIRLSSFGFSGSLSHSCCCRSWL